MIQATTIALYVGCGCYLAAAFVALRYWWSGNDQTLLTANRLSKGGACLLVLVFALRWIKWGSIPLTGFTDALSLFLLLSTTVMLLTLRNDPRSVLQCFYLPPFAAICLLDASVAHRYLVKGPRDIEGAFLLIHVGMVFLANAMFFVASLTSAAYVFQVRHLKRQRPMASSIKLPSLEQLERRLFVLIKGGYPIFIITLMIGAFWAWRDKELLSPSWWLSPKIILSWVMAGFYAATFHMRQVGWLRGPKLAYLVFYGFILLLTVSLIMGVLGLRDYNFWGTRE